MNNISSIFSSIYEPVKTPLRNALIMTVVITLFWFSAYRPTLIYGSDALESLLHTELPTIEFKSIGDLLNIVKNIQYLFTQYNVHEQLAVVWMNLYFFFILIIWLGAAVDMFIKFLEKGISLNPDVKGMAKYDSKAVHGSARFLKPEEYNKYYRKTEKDNPVLPPDRILGNDVGGVPIATKGPYAWINNGGHVLVIGKTGSGKTRRVVLPTIWILGHNKQSMIISDPKGEIYNWTHTFLEQQGYDVNVLNFLNPLAEGTTTWNPFQVIHRFIQEKDYNQANILIHFLANTILNVANQGQKGSDPFWDQSAEAYIKSALYALCYDPDLNITEKTFYNLVKTLVTFQDMSAEQAGSFSHTDPMYDWLTGVERKTGVNMTEQYALIRSAGASEKTLGSILATAWSKLNPIMNDILYIITRSSEIDFRQFGEKPSVLYIILPDETRVFDFFVSILVDFAYAELVQQARKQPTNSLPVPLWFLLDEFGNLPRINDIDKKFSVARSRKIHFLTILQSYSQLDSVYGKEVAKTIRSNITTTVFLGTPDLETAKEISDSLGVTTVRTDSVSYGKDKAKSANTTQRPLMTPDEVTRIRQPGDKGGPPQALVMEIGKLPMLSELEDMSAWPVLTQTFKSAVYNDIFTIHEADKELMHEAIENLPRRIPGQKTSVLPVIDPTLQTSMPINDEDEYGTYIGQISDQPPKQHVQPVFNTTNDDVALFIENKRVRISKTQLQKIHEDVINLLPSENEDDFNYVVRLLNSIRQTISK